MNPIEVIDKLNDMKSELMSRGWGKTKLENHLGNVCLLGARNIVVHGRPLQQESEEGHDGYNADEITIALIDALKEESDWKEYIENRGIDGYNTAHIYAFNDSDFTEFNDVIDLIDKAIINQKDKL